MKNAGKHADELKSLLKRLVKEHKRVLFDGDGYSAATSSSASTNSRWSKTRRPAACSPMPM